MTKKELLEKYKKAIERNHFLVGELSRLKDEIGYLKQQLRERENEIIKMQKDNNS